MNEFEYLKDKNSMQYHKVEKKRLSKIKKYNVFKENWNQYLSDEYLISRSKSFLVNCFY